MFERFNLLSYSNISDERVVIINPMLGLRAGAIMIGRILSWLLFPEIYIICLTFG